MIIIQAYNLYIWQFKSKRFKENGSWEIESKLFTCIYICMCICNTNINTSNCDSEHGQNNFKVENNECTLVRNALWKCGSEE